MGIDPDDEETALWCRVMETLLARGASPEEAIDGANLVLQAYRRLHHERHEGHPPPEGKEPEE